MFFAISENKSFIYLEIKIIFSFKLPFILFDEQVYSDDFLFNYCLGKAKVPITLWMTEIFSIKFMRDNVTLFIMMILFIEFLSLFSWSIFNVYSVTSSICHHLQDDYNESDKFVYFDS